MAGQPPHTGVGILGLVGVAVSAMFGYLTARKQFIAQVIAAKKQADAQVQAERLRLESGFRDQLLERITILDARVKTLEEDRDRNIRRISELETEKVQLLDKVDRLEGRVLELEADNKRLTEQVKCSMDECPFHHEKDKEKKE